MRLLEMISQTFDKAPKLFLKSFKQIFIVGFVMALLNELALSILPPIGHSAHASFNANATLLVASIFLILLVLTTIANSVTQVLLMSQAVSQPTTLKTALSITFNRLIRLLIGGFLFSCALVLGLMMYILPGLIFAALFFLYQPIIIFENIRVMDAFKRSLQLTKPSFLFTFFMLIAIYACLFVPQLLIDEMTFYFPALSTLDKVAVIFVMGIVAPFVNAIIVTVYSLLRQQVTSSHENAASH